ncbi:RCC1-like G exchanging factor-like protein [Halyomorpha halys]|uniref:RCC1-like G exchanging factor-like protein n=1 Tax=Halyomorpha halys TaxID=286706 RepID=UPI0006D4F55C|nr:RCC1-like G exchanging factor-like protein [Halyomorpha halys]
MEFCNIAVLLRSKSTSQIIFSHHLSIFNSLLRRSYCKEIPAKNHYRLYAFGLSEHGALGLHENGHKKVKKFVLKPVRHSFAEQKPVTNVAAGYGFTAFSLISHDTTKIYGCGINTDFQIGYHLSAQQVPLEIILKPVPVNIGLKDADTMIVGLSAGRAHLAVVTDKEGVFLLGANNYGQCAREVIPDDKLQGSCIVNRIPCLGNEPICDVVCGQDHTLFLTNQGKVWSCGWGADGQTGLVHTDPTSKPAQVRGEIENEKIIKIAARSDTVLALNCNGEVFGWGSSEYGQLSDSKDVQQINCPIKLKKLNCMGKVIDIAAGGSFCAALSMTGDVFVWGYGILGCGPELQKSPDPVMIPRTLFGCNVYQPDVRVCSIYCGLSHLAAINNCNHLYIWGRNRYGCLGIGHGRDQYFPYKVAFSALARKVSCGLDHTMVLGCAYD